MEKHDSGSAHNMYGILFTIVAVVALIALALVVSSNSQAAGDDDSGQQVGVTNSVPVISSMAVANISGGGDQATLNPAEGLQTPIFVHYTVTDQNGCGEVDDAVDHDSAIYQSTVTENPKQTCGADTDDCYQPANPADITLTGCTPGGADVDIVVEWDDMLEYWANPSAGGGPEDASIWTAWVEIDDTFGGVTTDTNDFELNAVRGHSVSATTNYGTLGVSTPSTVDSAQQTITSTQLGSVTYDLDAVADGPLTCDGPSSDDIPAGNVHIALGNGFTYGTADQAMVTGTPAAFNLSVSERTNSSGAVTKDFYSILRMPPGGISGTCNNVATYTAVADV